MACPPRVDWIGRSSSPLTASYRDRRQSSADRATRPPAHVDTFAPPWRYRFLLPVADRRPVAIGRRAYFPASDVRPRTSHRSLASRHHPQDELAVEQSPHPHHPTFDLRPPASQPPARRPAPPPTTITTSSPTPPNN